MRCLGSSQPAGGDEDIPKKGRGDPASKLRKRGQTQAWRDTASVSTAVLQSRGDEV